MRILIVTAGSRGDVAPYTGLALRLQQAGHEVAVAGHVPFGELVRRCGLEFRALPGDPVEMARERMAAPSPEAGHAIFVDFLHQLGVELAAAADAGTDLVLTASGPAPVSRLVAEAHGVPSLGAYLVPAVPTSRFPLPGWPDQRDLGAAANLAAGRALIGRADALYAEVLPRLRASLDLPADAPPRGRWPIAHGFSPSVVARPDDWPPEVEVAGYWWSATPTEWQPPSELLDFVQADDPPVFLGFGSMTTSDGAALSELVADAVARAGVRAVVQAGWAGLVTAGDDVLLVDDVPHEWLFTRTTAVVHHAGAGTTAAALRAGVPAVAVPFLLDQPFWAARLHALGVAPPPLPRAELTAPALAEALRSVIDDPSYRHRASELAQRIGDEDGAAAVIAMIDRVTG